MQIMDKVNRRIIINGRFLIRRITGVERYAREIIAGLDKIVEPNAVIMAVPPNVTEIPDYKNIEIIRVGIFHNNLWEQISLPLYVNKIKGGVLLNLCNTAPLLSPGMVCIHDMKIKARPKDFKKSFLMWYRLLFFNECKRAKRIITVSEFSKKEICKYYKVDPERIEVIPNAWQHFERIQFDEDALSKYKLTKGQFYFSLCSLEPNKNLKWIAEAANKNKEQIFVVAGTINGKIFSNALGFACPDNLRLIGYTSDEETKTLMRDCKAFLFPSFYEGFGIPPLEAISADCKNMLISDIEVMHEIFGDCVNYLNPYRPESDLECDIKDTKQVLDRYSWRMISAPRMLKLLKSI